MRMAMESVEAFCDEVLELWTLLASIQTNDWQRVTAFRNWTVHDVVLHLYAGDFTAIISVNDAHAFRELREAIQRIRASGLSMLEESKLRFPVMTSSELLTAWKHQAERLGALLDSKAPGDRVAWSGPSMSVPTFAAARQMETWAHGQEIFDVLGIERMPRERIRHIALLGVKTFDWSYRNRGLSAPEAKPAVRLTLPSGLQLEWNTSTRDSSIEGTAFEFCQVITQVRHVDDTSLFVNGTVARQWMEIAQCFAGPPVEPPRAGTRKRAGQQDNI
jgi:uncharacterized protein (TIGR03084 family)